MQRRLTGAYAVRKFAPKTIRPKEYLMLNIRTATADDADTISSLNHELHSLHAVALPHIYKQGSCEGFPSPCEGFPIKQVTEILADPNDRIFIAYWDEKPVGYLYCQIQHQEEFAASRARDQIYIHLMSVNTSHQRKGIGTALFRTVTDLAHELGIKCLGLDVWSFNQDAIAFYENIGFRITEYTMSMDL